MCRFTHTSDGLLAVFRFSSEHRGAREITEFTIIDIYLVIIFLDLFYFKLLLPWRMNVRINGGALMEGYIERK